MESQRGGGAGVGVQSLGGTGPIRAGHVPCPDMPSNLNRVGPLADRPAPPETWLADGNLRLAVMRAVRRRVIGASLPDSLPIRWSHPWRSGRRPARPSGGRFRVQLLRLTLRTSKNVRFPRGSRTFHRDG